MIGNTYQYIYAGPGPDVVSVVLVKEDGQEGLFWNLDGIYPESSMRLPLNYEKLTLCGPENWMSLMRSQKNKWLIRIMAEAYARKFNCDFDRVLQRVMSVVSKSDNKHLLSISP